MKRIPTVSIGIPAFNEEANIAYLLRALIIDSSHLIKLSEIIVVSDGSSDATVEQSRTVYDKRIRVIDRKKRLGIALTQNEIIRRAHGDILVMLDADVIPIQNNFLDRITTPLRRNFKVGCVGADTIPLPPRNLFERVIANSHYMKRYLYRRIRGGNNIYLCHGRGRAFSRPFYRQLRWPKLCPEDAYSYLDCIMKGFQFTYTDKAGVYFRSPLVLTEHKLQSMKFIAGINRLKELFQPKLIKNEYAIPRFLLLKTILKYIARNPFSTPFYLVLSVFLRATYSEETVRRLHKK